MGFAPGWKMTLFVVLMLPALVWLGLWQVERGALKQSLETAYLDRITQLPVVPSATALAEPFTRLRLRGEFSDQQFLLDNQVSGGVTGYWLVQAFVTETEQRLLVNRGFVPAPARREQLPAVSTPQGKVNVIGAVWPYLGLVPVLEEDLWADDWPKRIQRMDIARMGEVADARGIEVRLEAGQTGVAQAAPFAALLSDAKHRGYAATWFGLALVLTIGYVTFGVRSARINVAANAGANESST